MDNESVCENCKYYGNPCLNCAVYVHLGYLGPGYGYGTDMRILMLDNDKNVMESMRSWLQRNPGVTYMAFNNLSEYHKFQDSLPE